MLHQQTSVENPPRPLISFIIPCYNEPREMLTDCIESILSLPLRSEEREVIVVDDGSATPIATFLAPYGEASSSFVKTTSAWQRLATPRWNVRGAPMCSLLTATTASFPASIPMSFAKSKTAAPTSSSSDGHGASISENAALAAP